MSHDASAEPSPSAAGKLPRAGSGRKNMILRIFGALCILLFGMIIGSGLTVGIIGRKIRDLSHNPQKIPEHLIRHLEKQLDLTGAQKAEVAASVRSAFGFFTQKRIEHYPENRARVEQMISEIGAVLTPPQKEDFTEMKNRFLKHWQPPDASGHRDL